MNKWKQEKIIKYFGFSIIAGIWWKASEEALKVITDSWLNHPNYLNIPKEQAIILLGLIIFIFIAEILLIKKAVDNGKELMESNQRIFYKRSEHKRKTYWKKHIRGKHYV